MIYISGLIGFLLVLTAEARVGNSTQLKFCTETEQCLLFDPICETAGYEVRHYESTKWVSTDETSFFMEIAAMRAFKRLYRYITGSNREAKMIDMTAPVIVKMVDKRFWQMGVYTMSFLLPAEYQMNAPEPTDDKVYIQEMRDMTVYVAQYGGWMSYLADCTKAKTLSATLDAVDADYKKGSHYAVGYNSPMTLFNRHNEVWFVATGIPVCSNRVQEPDESKESEENSFFSW